MQVRKLTPEEFAATKIGKPEKIEAGEPLFDFWPVMNAPQVLWVMSIVWKKPTSTY